MRAVTLIEATCALLIARIATRTVRFMTVARWMGWQTGEAANEIDEASRALANQVGQSIVAANRLFKFENACLAESMAAKWMLDRRGVATTLCFGARIRGSAAQALRFEIDEHVALHAWLEAGRSIIIREMTGKHEVISRYC